MQEVITVKMTREEYSTNQEPNRFTFLAKRLRLFKQTLRRYVR